MASSVSATLQARRAPAAPASPHQHGASARTKHPLRARVPLPRGAGVPQEAGHHGHLAGVSALGVLSLRGACAAVGIQRLGRVRPKVRRWGRLARRPALRRAVGVGVRMGVPVHSVPVLVVMAVAVAVECRALAGLAEDGGVLLPPLPRDLVLRDLEGRAHQPSSSTRPGECPCARALRSGGCGRALTCASLSRSASWTRRMPWPSSGRASGPFSAASTAMTPRETLLNSAVTLSHTSRYASTLPSSSSCRNSLWRPARPPRGRYGQSAVLARALR